MRPPENVHDGRPDRPDGQGNDLPGTGRSAAAGETGEEDAEEGRGSGKDGKGTGKEDGSEEDDRRKEGMTVPIWVWIILLVLLGFWIIKTM